VFLGVFVLECCVFCNRVNLLICLALFSSPRRVALLNVNWSIKDQSDLDSTSKLLPKKMEQIECSKTSAIINQKPGNHPKEDILYYKHGESLKSRIHRHCLQDTVSAQETTVRNTLTVRTGYEHNIMC
jgi:hypothetical protein